MFITLTIDTHQKSKSKLFRFSSKKMNPIKGWRKAINMKKRTMWQKVKDWRKSMTKPKYRLENHAVMF